MFSELNVVELSCTLELTTPETRVFEKFKCAEKCRVFVKIWNSKVGSQKVVVAFYILCVYVLYILFVLTIRLLVVIVLIVFILSDVIFVALEMKK